jgi:hypothetical protein
VIKISSPHTLHDFDFPLLEYDDNLENSNGRGGERVENKGDMYFTGDDGLGDERDNLLDWLLPAEEGLRRILYMALMRLMLPFSWRFGVGASTVC